MILISFFCVLLLILNPALIYVFRKLEINLQKYQFWMMVSTGIVWIGSLFAFLLDPAHTLNLAWDVGSQLLPTTVFTLDNFSSSLILAINSILFAAALFQEYSPQQLAWLSGLGGICNLGLLADSPYTLLLILALVELILIINFITSADRSETTRRKMMAIIARLLIPFLVLLATLGSGIQSSGGTFSSLIPEAGPVLIAAGFLSSLGWVGFFRGRVKNSPELMPRIYSELLPGAIGLMLMLRGSMLVMRENPGTLAQTVPAIIALSAAIIGILIREPGKAWIISILAIIAGSAILGSPQDGLVWGLVFLLPGFLLRRQTSNIKEVSLVLILGSLGILTLPFLPAWSGANIFRAGSQGYLYAAAFGLAGGALLSDSVGKIVLKQLPFGTIRLTFIFGAANLILTQFIIGFSTTLIDDSVNLGAFSISSWIPGGIMVLFILIGYRLPELSIPLLDKGPDRLEMAFKGALSTSTGIIDQVINILAGLFEGEGGLIWALLIAFLIISLISLGGG